ncbi:MAG: hypothetical protein ACR2NP_04500 [Pirellulaceae bacterium]
MKRFDLPVCQAEQSSLRVSAYDRLHASLSASVVVLGALVFILMAVWLASFDVSTPLRQATMLIGQPSGEIANNQAGLSMLDVPDPPVATPQLELQLQAMQELPSSVLAAAATLETAGQGKAGLSGGIGDRRLPGPAINDDIRPDWERWKIEYSADTVEQYMEILQSFNISIGAIHQVSNRIYQVSDLTTEQGTVTETDRSHAGLYFYNQNRRLRNWDQGRVTSAGVDVDTDYLLVHFYPESVRDTLRELENDVLERDGIQLQEIDRIVFRVRPGHDGFEYFVHEVICPSNER